MAQQTAVEWFEQNISKYIHYEYEEAYEQHQLVTLIFEQAKLMEKQQIIEAHGKKINGGFRGNGDFFNEEITGEQYYNETYKQ